MIRDRWYDPTMGDESVDVYEPVVRDRMEGWRCRICGAFVPWSGLLPHFASHMPAPREEWPDDELTG